MKIGEESYCYCDEACHSHDDCCVDILEIGCYGKIIKMQNINIVTSFWLLVVFFLNTATNCKNAGLDNTCTITESETCTVQTSENEKCQCDRKCGCNGDCCSDASESKCKL